MPGGRPSAPRTIVRPDEILGNDAIIQETYNIKWCAQRKLLKNSQLCARCNNPCGLIFRTNVLDNKTWYCSVCKTRISIRSDSWFQKSRLPIYYLVVLTYCWSFDYPLSAIAREASCDETKTAIDWANFCREACEQFLEQNPTEIGGFDDNGEPLVVEVDESKYFHRKYHRGQWAKGHWVVGGIERGSRKCFVVLVPDRTEQTLRNATLRWILPGTHIISDGWRAYANIDTWANGVYTHSVIVHQQHFVDPGDDDIHTQNIENMWMLAKRKLRRQFGTSDALFPSYLHEFVWRQSIPDKKFFQHFLNVIGNIYPL